MRPSDLTRFKQKGQPIAVLTAWDSLSAALAACRGRNLEVIKAAKASKEFISKAIAFADQMNVGRGHGPIHHFHALW